MDNHLHIRPADGDDIVAISRIIDRAIRRGCAADHRNDPYLVDAWARSATPEQVRRWLAEPGACARLAILHGKPAGVGMARAEGEISLCYVLPESSRRGVGLALMSELQDHLHERGCLAAWVGSTVTGRGFYRHLGYRETGPSHLRGGLLITPMEKNLMRPAMGDWAMRLSANV
jgi:GNAT superfamily N-acetyltransferase